MSNRPSQYEAHDSKSMAWEENWSSENEKTGHLSRPRKFDIWKTCIRSELGVVSLFSDGGLVFSRSDPISFADMATCDWLHKLCDLKNLQVQFLDLMQVSRSQTFLVSREYPFSQLPYHAFQLQASYLEGPLNIALLTSHAIGKGDKHGGRWPSPSIMQFPLLYIYR